MADHGKVRSFRIRPVQDQQLSEIMDRLQIPPGSFQTRIILLIAAVHNTLCQGSQLKPKRPARARRQPEPEPEPDQEPEPAPEPATKEVLAPPAAVDPPVQTTDQTYEKYCHDQFNTVIEPPKDGYLVCPCRDEWIQAREFCPGCKAANPKMYASCQDARQTDPYGELFITSKAKPTR